MKAVLIILLISGIQTSASFFNDFQTAFVDVESSFGKLLNDVVSDVKVTIDCTLLAVEQALSMGGIFHESSDYDSRCRNENTQNVPPPVVQDTSYVSVQSTSSTYQFDKVGLKSLEIAKGIKEVSSEISQNIGTSISNANKTIENAKSALKNETNHLSEVRSLLSQELDDISTNVKSELIKQNLDVPNLISEVHVLENLEQREETSPKDTRIRDVMDEVLDAFHSEGNPATLSKDKEIKDIMNNLEKTSNVTFSDIQNQYSQFKNEEMKHLDDIKNFVQNQDVKRKTIPKNFKDLAKSIFDESAFEVESQSSVKNVNEHKIIMTTTTTTPVPVEEPTDEMNDPDLQLFNEYFGSKKSNSGKEAADEAAKLIEQSQYTQKIMENFFKSTSQDDAVSVFDNPDLLSGFGDS